MKRGLIAGAAAVFGLVFLLDGSVQGGKDKPVTIKVVMKKVMAKGALKDKFVKGEATADEKKELISLITDLGADTPPKGDAADWKTKTKALLDAAKADDGKAFGKAANCKACHSEHKK